MNKTLMIVLVVLMLILIGSISFGVFYIYSNMPKQEKVNEEKIVVEESKKPLLSYDYKDAVFNITNSKAKEKIVKLSFTLKISGNQEDLSKIEELKSNMDDAIIFIISGSDSDTLMKLEGKNILKEEIITQLNQIFLEENIPCKVNKVLITELIIK